MHYPLIKYFSVNANPPSLGLVMGKYDNVDEFRHSLIDLLEKEQQEGRGTSWPNITPYRYIDLYLFLICILPFIIEINYVSSIIETMK